MKIASGPNRRWVVADATIPRVGRKHKHNTYKITIYIHLFTHGGGGGGILNSLLPVREGQHLVQQPYFLPLQHVHVVQHYDRLPGAPLDSRAQVLVEPRLCLQGRAARYREGVLWDNGYKMGAFQAR